MTDEKKTNKSADEWRDLFVDIGQQVRRDMARMVGADEDADWSTIGRQTDESAREGVARAVGAGPDADWDSIGQHLDQSTRREIGKIVGAADDADWGTIGQAVSKGIASFFDDLFGSGQAAAAKPFEETKSDEAVDPWKTD